MISILHNMAAMNAQRQLNINNQKQVKNAERLSSGYKINRAADDAAGLAMSEKMRRQVRGLRQSVLNIKEGIGYVQTAEGALNEVDELMQRMNELAVKGANGTLQEEDRQYVDNEFQALKQEMDRIFRTTTFNGRRIWEADPDSKYQIGTEWVQAVTERNTYNRFDITDENCGVVPVGSFQMKATKDDGISVTWMGYDGTQYTTEPIDWDTLKEKNYEFEMSDYFGGSAKNPTLYKADGTPQFTHRVAFSVAEAATVDDIIASIDSRYMGAYSHASYTAQFEDAAGNIMSYPDVYVYSGGLSYPAAYVSSQASANADRYTFDGATDLYLEPSSSSGNLAVPSGNTSDVGVAKASTDTWTFSFDMVGIGTVKATSYNVSYSSPARETADEDLWWEWAYYWSNGYKVDYKDGKIYYTGGGTLGDVMDVLTGDRNAATPGLLTAKNGGASDQGGSFNIHFSLEAENAFTYGDGYTTTNVGTMSVHVSVSPNDTEQTVLDKINAALKSDTVVDFYTPSQNSDYSYAESINVAPYQIESPIWAGAVYFWVQGGTEADQQIELYYDALSTNFLELDTTKTDTPEDCKAAIDAIKKAMHTVNKQRAEFGAYQNRLEHAANNNSNVEENTQAAESRIRDADMAATMVEYANRNILLQAGQATLAQANQANQGILSLLQ